MGILGFERAGLIRPVHHYVHTYRQADSFSFKNTLARICVYFSGSFMFPNANLTENKHIIKFTTKSCQRIR